MFVRIEVAMRPDHPDSLANALLRRIEVQDSEVRKKIRWARLLDVYWLEIPRAREEIIPACQEIFQDRVTQWLFTGNLIPSASGLHGGIEDLLEACPVRPGKFWGLERRIRPGVPDSKAAATAEALRLVIGDSLPGLRASSGQMLLLEGVQIQEEDLSRLARNIWCNPAFETWSFLPESELSGNERFFQDRVRKDDSVRGAPVVKASAPTLQSFAQRLGSPRVVATSASSISEGNQPESVFDWLSVDDSQREVRLKELTPVLGRVLQLDELTHVLKRWSAPDEKRHRSSLGLPSNPTLAELQMVAAAWSEEFRQSTLSFETAADDLNSGLISSTVGATVQQNPKSWIISAGDHRPAVVALDENTWLSFGLRNSSLRPIRDVHDSTLQSLLGGQRDLMGSVWPSLPLAQSHVHFLSRESNQASRAEQASAVEFCSTRTQIPIIAGAEGQLVTSASTTASVSLHGIASATLGIVVRKTHTSVRAGDRLFVIAASGAPQDYLDDPIFQRKCLDALAELESRGVVTAIRCSGPLPAIAAAVELARHAGGLHAEFAPLFGRKEQFLVSAAPNLTAELQATLSSWGLDYIVCGQFTESGRVLLTRGSKPVGEVPLDFIWNGPPVQAFTVSEQLKRAQQEYRAPDHPPFDKQGDRILRVLLGQQGVRSPETLVLSGDLESQAHIELKPLHAGGVGGASFKVGPNDGSVLLVGPQLIGLSEFSDGLGYEIALGVGLFQRSGVYDPRWEAEAAFDEAIRNSVAIGGCIGMRETIAGVGVQWFGPSLQDGTDAAGDLKAAFEGIRDAALALELPVLSTVATFSRDLQRGLVVCHSVAQLRGRRRAKSADFKFSGDLIFVLGPEVDTLAGSRFASSFGCADALARRPMPNWDLARRIYSWLGGAAGKEQTRLRSVHDISDGGLLAAIAESCFARKLGASLRMPGSSFPEAWAFGEGFHRFVVTCSESDSTTLQAEWDAMGIPFQQVGSVTATDRLEVIGCWSADIGELHRVWKDGGSDV